MALIRAGIRIPDHETLGLRNHRGWHAITHSTNYIASCFYVSKVIKTKDCDPTNIDMPDHMKVKDFNEMKSDIESMPWDEIWSTYTSISNYSKSDTNKRFLLWGMLMHIATDTYAHRAYQKVDGVWEEIDVGTDNINVCPIRYKAAGRVVKNIMRQCINTEAPYSSNYFSSKQMALSTTYYNGEMKIQDLAIYALLNRLNEPNLDSYSTALGKGTMPTTAERIGLLKRFGIYYE